MNDQAGLANEDSAFVNTQRFQDIKTAAYDNLLTRIEELGAEFGRWSRSAIQQFVNLDEMVLYAYVVFLSMKTKCA